jgi:hypothetical protein
MRRHYSPVGVFLSMRPIKSWDRNFTEDHKGNEDGNFGGEAEALLRYLLFIDLPSAIILPWS